MEAAEVADDGAADEAPEGWDWEPHPWRRYAARIIDLTLFGTIGMGLLGLLLNVVAPQAVDWALSGSLPANFAVLPALTWLLSAPFTAWFLSRWRTSPGKALFGIRVVALNGERISYRRALHRELLMTVRGGGVGLPLISFLCMVKSYSDLEAENRTPWDDAAETRSEGGALDGWQYFGRTFGTVILLAIKAVDVFEQLASLNPER
jgi:uncharacterized RDD family membrane protein YckC